VAECSSWRRHAISATGGIVGAASKELGKPLADVFRFLPPTSPSFGLVELKTKADPRATRVAVILVGGAVIPIIVRVPPVMVGVIVPIILACVITMMAAPATTVLFVA
jgi:hypothetical protein